MIKLNWPVEDLAGYVEGAPFSIRLRETLAEDRPFALRDYQHDAISSFHRPLIGPLIDYWPHPCRWRGGCALVEIEPSLTGWDSRGLAST